LFENVRLARQIARFVRERLPFYGPLLRQDLHRFQVEAARATVGVSLALSSGLMFCCFLSRAVIVSAWKGPHRVLAAWLICGGWGVLSSVGMWIMRRALAGPAPFRLISGELSYDHAAFVE
jgi:hypothetical protein